MNLSMYSIRIFDLENEIKDGDDFDENLRTNLLFRRAYVCQIGPFSSSRLFPVTLHDVHKYTMHHRRHRRTL